MQKVSDEEFIRTWRECGASPAKVSSALGINLRNVYRRRERLEKSGRAILGSAHTSQIKFDSKREATLEDGFAIVFSDAHYWPGEPSTAHRALVKLISKLKPKLIVANGDLLDGVRISRHEPRGWNHQPGLVDEIHAVVTRLGEIEAVAKGATLLRTLGNHDVRFERFLAMHAREYEGLKGTSLDDYIPRWPSSWLVEINNDVVVKHRNVGGIHATYNNTLRSGRSIITGHMHSMKCTPWTDYNGIRFGVDAGCLADPDHDAFDYTEGNPKDWRSGFAVLTFKNKKLLWPEFCYVDDGVSYFRGAAL